MTLDDFRKVLSADLRSAMKARSAAEVTAIRALLGALDNSTAVEVVQTRPFAGGPTEVARRELTPGDIDAVIEREAAEREAAAATARGPGLEGTGRGIASGSGDHRRLQGQGCLSR